MYKINPVHPGEILKTEFLEPFGISAYRLAKDIEVPINRITEIVNKQRNISTETALLLAKYFSLSDSFWIRIQSRYDEAVTKEKIFNHLASIRPLATMGKGIM
ncbi:MAG: HigA family addiction module antidote protein [Rickettsia endosymbiont of Culicoides impunctatus]|uniref:HigA family addiction module antitoxin n=1 Tax=unclassified Candidatus Tisiphia TaxID=2996318 RepID=UPI001E7249DF|nr:MAG: HigA family addiction module antidote protein [Rickettsia endosymbiont of Culicoides impunctatus]